MTGKQATVYCVVWISIGTMFSVSVVSCRQYNMAVDVRKAELDAAQWNGLREDCQKHGGLMVKAWGTWNCEVGK